MKTIIKNITKTFYITSTLTSLLGFGSAQAIECDNPTECFERALSELIEAKEEITHLRRQLGKTRTKLNKYISDDGEWKGKNSGLVGPQGPQGPQGLQGLQGPPGPQGPGAYWANGNTWVIPGSGGVLHMNRGGDVCLYIDNQSRRCWNLNN